MSVDGVDPFVRLLKPAATAVPVDALEVIDRLVLARRDAMAEEMRVLEAYLLERGKITRVLCAPGRMR